MTRKQTKQKRTLITWKTHTEEAGSWNHSVAQELQSWASFANQKQIPTNALPHVDGNDHIR